MVQFDFGNKQFTEWLLSFDIDRRSHLLTEVQQQLAQMGLRDDQMQRALQQVCQRTEVQMYRLSPEDITMYMQGYENDEYSNRLRNCNWQSYRRPKYYNERPQLNDVPYYRTQYDDLKSPNIYREGYRDHYKRSKYSDSNHPIRPVGREYFKLRDDHQLPPSQRRMKDKRRFCYSFDDKVRKQVVNSQENKLREKHYYEEEAVLSRKVPCFERSVVDRTELSLPEGKNSIQCTRKYPNCTKARSFKDTKFKKTHFVETSGKTERFNESEKKQVSGIEKCAKSGNYNTNISTNLQKTDISVEIDIKKVNNKLTDSTKTKKLILNSNKSTNNKNFETSSSYNVATDTEVFKKHTQQDDTTDKALETIVSVKKIVFDNQVPSEEGHSLPSDVKLMNSNTNIGPDQSVSLHQNCAVTSKSEVKIKPVSNFSNEHCSGSEIRSPLSFESSEHTTLPSGDKTFESVLSSTSHCAEDRKRSLGIGSRIKDAAGNVKMVEILTGTTTKKDHNNSKVISKILTDSVKKTSPQCYTTIDEYYNCKAKSCDKEVASNTSSTQLGGSEFKTQCSSNIQSRNCNIKDLFTVTNSNLNKRDKVKSLNSAVKSNFQQELDGISESHGIVVGTSDFHVLDNITHQKRKENKTQRPVSKKKTLVSMPQVKRGTGFESPLDKELAISEVKPNNSLNNPYSRIKEIPQVTNVTLKHGLHSVQRRSSAPASSSSDNFKRTRSHSYDGEQSKLFGQVDILKEGNAPISKVKKFISKEDSTTISTALKEKEQKKLVLLDNKTQVKKFSSQSVPSEKNKLSVLKDSSKRTVPYSSDNLSTKKRKKIVDLFGEEDFEDPALKKLSKSDEKSQTLLNESEQSSEQTKNEQQNIISESLVNPLGESDLLPKSIDQNKNLETLNKMADNDVPGVIKSSSDYIPETIMGTKVIAENIEAKVEINMDTIPLLFPGPQDELPSIVAYDSEKGTENNNDTMENEERTTSQSTSSISGTAVVSIDGCEKNKQSSSTEENRHLESLVVQDTLQSNLRITLDSTSDSNITKDPLDVDKQIPETSKAIETQETSDPGTNKSIVTRVSENNHIEDNSMLQSMEDSTNNFVNNVILPSYFPEKTVLTSSVFQGNISHVPSASTASNNSNNFQTFNINHSITATRPASDNRELRHSKEGIIEQLQNPQASINEIQNHAIINPCDNQIVESTSEVVQQDNNSSALPAIPTYRIRVRDPAYLGIAANSSKTYDKTSTVCTTNVQHSNPTKDETTQYFSFPAMDKSLQQLAEITYTMLHDKDRCFERIKAADSLTSLTDIKSSEKNFAKRDFYLSLLRKVEIYCKLLTTVNIGLGNKTEDTLLCRVNGISKERKYTLREVKEIKLVALEMEKKRLRNENSNNEAPRLEAAHPHLDPNVSTLPLPSIASQNAISNQITQNRNSTIIKYAPSSSHDIGQITPQPGHQICSDKTRGSVSQMQSGIVQNVLNRSSQVSGGNSVRPPPPLYISQLSVQRNIQKPETSLGRNTTQNTAGVPSSPYRVYSITHITNHQNQPIFHNSSNQQSNAPPSGIINNSIVQPTQKKHQAFPHPLPQSSTTNMYQHKLITPQIGFQNSSVSTLYQQKQVQLPSTYPKQTIIPHRQACPNVTINQQNQVLQQTPLHGSMIGTSSQQKQIPQMGYGSALHSSNQLRHPHHSNVNASQFPANNYKDMQFGVQHPSRNQPLVHALLAAGSGLTVPSYKNLGKMFHKEQKQQFQLEQQLPQNQKPSIPSSTFPVLPQIRSHQHLLQFYQQYQNQQQEQVSQHQKKQQEPLLQPQEQPQLRQFQQSLSYLELGQRQHHPVQIQQNQLQQPQQWHQQERQHQAKKRHTKEQVQQTQKQHQQEQLQPMQHQQEQLHQPQLQQEQLLQVQQQHHQQQEHMLQSQRHQQGQMFHPQQWHKQSQLQQYAQEKLKQQQQQYQLEQMQFSQQNQQGLLQQTQHQQEQFQQNHQLPPPPNLLRLQPQSQEESQLLTIPLRHMERMAYDHPNYRRQLQPNNVSPNLPEVALNAVPLSQNSVEHQKSNPKNPSNEGTNHQNSLGTEFEQNKIETINQALTARQTSVYQSLQHPRANSILQHSPPQSNTSTSLIHSVISAKQKQLASHVSSERCKGMPDTYLDAQRLVPEVVTEQATTINVLYSDVNENISTPCPLDNVPNLGKDNPMKNATFSNKNNYISSESEMESTGPEISHSEQMTSSSELQPPLETEITLSNLLHSGDQYFSTNYVGKTITDSQITDKHKQFEITRCKRISDTSIDAQRLVPEVAREQTTTENLDDIVVNVGNCDFSIEESSQNCKKPKKNDNENIEAVFVASHSFSQTNSANNIEANSTMSSEGMLQSKMIDINKHCDRISSESRDITEITIEPNDFRIEPTTQNCKKPEERARGQRDMPSLEDIEAMVVLSPLNDCMPIGQEDVDIEVIGEFPPQLRTLSRDSGYTTPTHIPFAIKEDGKDAMLFEEEAIKIEEHSENVHYQEIITFEDKESKEAVSKDIKSCFETEEMDLSSSSSDDKIISRIKMEGGGLIFMELDKDSCCAVCERSAKVMCSGCKSMTYCSETCQIKDWKESHYLVCLGSCSDT